MKSKQYPEQLGPYVVKVKSEKSADKWQDFDTARLQISVGQEYHEGDKMVATLDWLRSRFPFSQICVNDTLQRFNLMFEDNLGLPEALKISRERGQIWAQKYGDESKRHESSEIIHWDFWLGQSDYTVTRDMINDIYRDHEEFRNLISQNIEDIWARRRVKKPEIYTDERYHEFFALSCEYLLEEISVFSMMFENRRAIDIYPGTTIFAATILQGRTIPGAPSGLGKGHFCRIDFSRNHSFAANANTRPIKDNGLAL